MALGADHAGFELKEALKPVLEALGVTCVDFGTNGPGAVDYPDIASRVARGVGDGAFDRGVLVCGSGIGMAIAANKIPGVRASVVADEESARLARAHNDLNILTLAGRRLTPAEAARIVRAFLDTPFDGGRHGRRVEKIHQLESPPQNLRT